MATLEDILRLPCFEDVFQRDRHPLLVGQDLANLRLAGAVSRESLANMWRAVALDLEIAAVDPLQTAFGDEPRPHTPKPFVHQPLRLVDDPAAVASLGAPRTREVARDMGITARGRTKRDLQADVLRVHEESIKTIETEAAGRYPVAHRHREMWKYVAKRTVTKGTLARLGIKNPQIRHTLAPNPHFRSSAPMCLYAVRDVVEFVPWKSCQGRPRFVPAPPACLVTTERNDDVGIYMATCKPLNSKDRTDRCFSR